MHIKLRGLKSSLVKKSILRILGKTENLTLMEFLDLKSLICPRVRRRQNSLFIPLTALGIQKNILQTGQNLSHLVLHIEMQGKTLEVI